MQMITLHHADDNNKKNEQVFMRIITGEFKGRHFDVPRSFKARPTTDFAKENIFNVMNGYIDFNGIEALDLFAGTGSISLELLSRGCQAVTSIEADRDHAAFIRQCVAKLGVTNHNLIRGDVFRFLKSCRRQFDFIFADPRSSMALMGCRQAKKATNCCNTCICPSVGAKPNWSTMRCVSSVVVMAVWGWGGRC